MEKAYDPKQHEAATYTRWETAGAFTPKVGKTKPTKTFTISLPPPNVTGTLHTGHAIMLAIQDALVRFHRMRGETTLWLPGTDHASIATQTKVEKLLAEKGVTRHQLGREAFLREVWDFVRASQGTITKQVRAMGSSVDWTRERFTLDEGLSAAVREAFVRLYEDGLITRGKRVVNWCPRCASTLADDEVEYIEEKTPFYYFQFGPVVISTARPETKFQDKTVVVHPKDERYRHLVGTEFEFEWIEGPVKGHVITDHTIDMTLGSGAMTITPAHSHEDFAMAEQHGLPIIQIINEEGNLTEAAGSFAGRNARDARADIIAILQKKGLVVKIDHNYVHNLSVCYRCNTPIEPLLSDQWFVRVDQVPKSGGKTLKQRALDVLKDGPGHVTFLPERFEKTYAHWISNLRDWCISRQIWWGHQIPVWERVVDGVPETYVGREAPKGDGWVQDPDTLDTWFSSGLWTFSTLGWPEKTKDLKAFHPTSVLETGYDILFFWIARMILLSTYLVDEIPFRTVYLHGLVRDGNGVKMSKSLGNIVDPLDLIDAYGTDALRLAMLIGTAPGNDVNLGAEKVAGYRNFVNKLWNVARFVQMTSADLPATAKVARTTLADKWITSRVARLHADVTAALTEFRIGEAGQRLYEFLWSDFADWYLEASKVQPNPALLRRILQGYLQLLHPLAPYVTEVLWGELGFEAAQVATTEAGAKAGLLMLAKWPAKPAWADTKAERDFGAIQSLVQQLRSIRADRNLPLVAVTAKKLPALLADNATLIAKLAGLSRGVDTQVPATGVELALQAGTRTTVLMLELGAAPEDAIDPAKRAAEITELEKMIASYERNLANPSFVAKAPPALVAQTKERIQQAKEKLALLQK